MRPANPEEVYKKLYNGLRKKLTTRSSLSSALFLKKTIKVGNKTDPYQPIEMELGITREILKKLIKLQWSFAIQTRFLHNLLRDEDLLQQAHTKKLLTIIPVISPGAEWDWKVLERGRTTPIEERLKILKKWVKYGWNIGVNGEPFIPGLHTIKQFESIITRLREIGIKSYNTYNLHFNDYVAKRLHSIGLDILKIWKNNQDYNWKKIQLQLCTIAKEKGIILACPDFVNTGKDWIEETNTCCGVNVPNPSKFNTHIWKRLLQKGMNPKKIIEETWEGIGDKGQGERIIKGKKSEYYTMREARM